MKLNPALAERLDDEEYPVQDAVDFLQGQLDSGLLEGINEGAVCVLRDAIATREEYITELETERDLHRWGLQWMLNNLTGIDHEWAKEACNIARQSLNPLSICTTLERNTMNRINDLAERFCAATIPDSVCADLCATRQGPGRTGTNLLSVIEAREVLGRIMEEPPCTWAEDSDGVWNASCPPVGDHSFCFTEDGPTENGFKFCPYCGKPLVASAFDPNAD